MYLAKLRIKNFRRLQEGALTFKPGLNVIVGENNGGKTATIDAIRTLLNDYKLEPNDLYANEERSADSLLVDGLFKRLTPGEEAAFVDALVNSDKDGVYDARFAVSATYADDELRTTYEVGTAVRRSYFDVIEWVRVDYLKPLRDPNTGTGGLRAGRRSRIAELLSKTTSEEEKDELEQIGLKANQTLKDAEPIGRVEKLVRDNLSSLTGGSVYQENTDIDFIKPRFPRLAAQLEAYANGLGIDMAGLGSGNLIYIAAVLGELEKSKDRHKRYRALIIEEPEAHLHPHLQILLLRFLQEYTRGDNSAQVFVTTHSPIFASQTAINGILPISHNVVIEKHNGENVIGTRVQPVDVDPTSSEALKIEQYLDATRSELFFAKRVLLVEGDAERFALKSLAKAYNAAYDFEKKGVSLLSAAGLNFKLFLPFLGSPGMSIPTAIVTDGDAPPQAYGSDELEHSDYVKTLKEEAAKYATIEVFPSDVTFEYDLAAEIGNRDLVLAAIKVVRPIKSRDFAKAHGNKTGKAFATEFYKEFFKDSRTSKPQFAAEFALLADQNPGVVSVPSYIRRALDFIFKSL